VIALIQRVSSARVQIAGQVVGKSAPDSGLHRVTPADTDENAEKLVSRMLKYRIFADEAGKMNLNLQQIAADCCWCRNSRWLPIRVMGCGPVPTAAPLSKGSACSIGSAAARALHTQVATGRFGADMQVSLVNDGR